MKNRNIQFKATAGLVAPLPLSCSMAVFTLTPSPALGDDHQENSQPFTGTVSGTIPEDLGPPVPDTGVAFSIFSHPIPETPICWEISQGPQTLPLTSAMEATLALLTGLRPMVTEFPVRF
jgi:hypothetical protein